MNYDHTLDKHQLRRSFERAAPSYDVAAVLQREVCDRMLVRLNYIKHTPDFILDIGSGTGYGSRNLATRFPASKILAVDIALSMHLKARPPVPWWKPFVSAHGRQTIYTCGDIESLPVRDSCSGLVWSNLTLQWCNDIRHTFSEVRRVLQPGGLFMFSTFGPDTLKELRQAFRSVDNYSHINRFTDMHDIGDMLVHNGFATPVMDMEYITLTYDDVISVMKDLRTIGARNVTEGRAHGLTGRVRWQKMINHYESLRVDGKLPATFEVIYGHAWKPLPRKEIGKIITKHVSTDQFPLSG